MTEGQWLVCDDPRQLITSVCVWRLHTFSELGCSLGLRRKTATMRRYRLFACACLRQAWHRLAAPCGREAVETAERCADGEAPAAALVTARRRIEESAAVSATGRAVNNLARLLSVDLITTRPTTAGIGATDPSERFAAFRCVAEATDLLLGESHDDALRPGRLLSRVFRDVFGNPFRPVPFFPEWRTHTALNLARPMYESRDFSAMPILADALQDAGCDNAHLLDHCRDPGPHVRGCWAVDLVLGKG